MPGPAQPSVASVHVIGGNGNPLALSLSAGDAIDFAVSGSDIVVGDLGIAAGHCGLTRTVTVTTADGTQRMLQVSPMAANISSTKVGDNVELGIEDTRTFVLSSPGVRTPAPGAASAAGAVETSQGVAGARVSQSIANWVVVSVNPAANTITLVNPGGGEVRNYNVTTDAGRQQLPRVKQGDSLTEINSRLVVASITPKS